MKYSKPHLSFDAQLQKSIDRGMHVDDVHAATHALQRVGYYRLSAYWHHWRMQDNETGSILSTYHPAARFEDAMSLYSFDRRLRLLILDAIERIEIALRVSIAYVGGKRDPFIHTKPEVLNRYSRKVNSREKVTQYEICSRHIERLWRSSSEDFVKHAQSKYETGPAIWVVIETWDFGLVSNFYKLLPNEDQLTFAEDFLVGRHAVFESWVATLNHVRNICAHHSRLFRKPLVVAPTVKHTREIPELMHLREITGPRAKKIYSTLAIIAYLMKTADPESSWASRARDLFESFDDLPTASLADYGFPDDWKSQAIWI